MRTHSPLMAILVLLTLPGLAACGDDDGSAADAAVVQDASLLPDATPDASLLPDAAPEPFAVDPQRIFDDVEALSATAMAGREPGTAGNVAALDYVEDVFLELGLQAPGGGASYRQSFTYDAWKVLPPTTLVLDGTVLVENEDFVTMSYTGSADASAEVVFVGYGLTVPAFSPAQYPDCPLDPTGYDDYAGVDVAGKIALVLRHGPRDDEDVYNGCPPSAACVGEPCNWNFGYKATNAGLHGAVAMLLVEDYRHPADELFGADIGLDYYQADFGALFVDRTPFDEALPELRTWADTIDASLLPFSQATGLTAAIHVAAELATVTAENVVGAVPGTDATRADEIVVVGGHVDHLGVDPVTGEIYAGADDNASGTAVMMELARAVAHPSFAPARTVVFAAWNAEEAGLLGSCYYVQYEPLWPVEDTVAMLSVDMVGAGDGSGILVYGGNLAENEWLSYVLRGTQSYFELPWQVTPTVPLDASDHVCFAQAGVPAVLISTRGDHAFYHTPADTIETIGLGDLEAAASLLKAGVESLALGEEDRWQPGSKPAAPSAREHAPGWHPWIRTR